MKISPARAAATAAARNSVVEVMVKSLSLFGLLSTLRGAGWVDGRDSLSSHQSPPLSELT